MKRVITYAYCAFIIYAFVLLQGCSEIEPKTGTKVIFSFPKGKKVSREHIAETSRYLIGRAQGLLRVNKPRVAYVTDDSIVLLLPGKKIARKDAERLTEAYSIEFYYMLKVASKKNPVGEWKIVRPQKEDAPYIFLGPNAQRIDSIKNPHELLTEVVGYPNTKPILTGRDILPNASFSRGKNIWAVLVQFNEEGAKKFHAFTRIHSGEYLAVFYNGVLVSAPIIEGPIQGDKAFITGFRSVDQAKAAVEDLNLGTLPVKLKTKSITYY